MDSLIMTNKVAYESGGFQKWGLFSTSSGHFSRSQVFNEGHFSASSHEDFFQSSGFFGNEQKWGSRGSWEMGFDPNWIRSFRAEMGQL